MIELKNNVVTIQVSEDNPIYGALSRFVGESFEVVRASSCPPWAAPDTRSGSLSGNLSGSLSSSLTGETLEEGGGNAGVVFSKEAIEDYISGLDEIFEEKSFSKTILKHHATRFFSQPGRARLWSREHADVYFKEIDGSPFFVALPSLAAHPSHPREG